MVDYYSFGMQMPGRQYTASGAEYRYGFNGMEGDDEVKGEGNSYTAEFWQYDSRLGRRWNRDPITFPWNGGYTCLEDNPISNVDPDGLYTRKRAERKRNRAARRGWEVGEVSNETGNKRNYSFSMSRTSKDQKGDFH